MLIALFSDDPLDALWLAIAFTALQQIEGHVVAPNVFAQALRINPLLVIFALLLGGQLYGFIGAFIALPIAAILRETVVYLRRHLVLEPWDLPRARAVARAGRRRPTGAACPECGAPSPPDADATARPAGPSSGDADERRRPPAAACRGPAMMRRAQGVSQALRRRGARCASVSFEAAPRRAGRDHRPQRRRQDDAAADPRRRADADGGRGRARRRAGRLGPAAAGALLEALGAREPAAVRAAGEGRRRRRGGRPDARADRAARPRRRRGRQALGRQPPAGQHRHRPARRPAGAAARRAVGLARPAPARAAVGVRRPRSPQAARRSSTRPTTSPRPSATPTACSCSPTASCCSPARPRELERATGGDDAPTSRPRSSASCTSGGTDAHALAAAQGPPDPAPLAAAGRRCWCSTRSSSRSWSAPRCPSGPEKPKVAFANLVPPEQAEINARRPARSTRPQYADELFESIDPIRVKTREEAIAKVQVRRGAGRARDPAGRDRAPAGHARPRRRRAARRSRSSTTPRTRSSGATSRRRSTPTLADANEALSATRSSRSRRSYLNLIVAGGEFALPARRRRSTSSACATRRRSSRRR